jgi:hypothetical protein
LAKREEELVQKSSAKILMLYMKIYIDTTGKNQQDHSCMHELM